MNQVTITVGYYDWRDFDGLVVLDLSIGNGMIKEFVTNHTEDLRVRSGLKGCEHAFVYLNAPYSCFIHLTSLARLLDPDFEAFDAILAELKSIKKNKETQQRLTVRSRETKSLLRQLEHFLDRVKANKTESTKNKIKGVYEMEGQLNNNFDTAIKVLLTKGCFVQRIEDGIAWTKMGKTYVMVKEGQYYTLPYRDLLIKNTSPTALIEQLEVTEIIQDALDTNDYLEHAGTKYIVIQSDTEKANTCLYTVLPNHKVYMTYIGSECRGEELSILFLDM
jgi:hypothetical protein